MFGYACLMGIRGNFRRIKAFFWLKNADLCLMKRTIILTVGLFTAIVWFSSCKSQQQAETPPTTEDTIPEVVDENPPAPGFNLKGSDKKAIEVVDEMVKKMGGRKGWDESRYFTWNFFGKRKHYWDKTTGDIRVEYLEEDKKVLLNINTKKGNVLRNGVLETNIDSIKLHLFKAFSHWINDSYWLFMPFKMKDSGVTLKYKGYGTVESNFPAHTIEMTFKNTGLTPQNKYLVYISTQHMLVSQWAFFRDASKEQSDFVSPWKGYTPVGRILLSLDRGERKFTEVGVFDYMNKEVFTAFDPVDVTAFY